MTQTNQTAIYFENVCYEIDGISILNNITGSFYKGKITTLVGPSGAGKSTLLKMCNNLHSPTSGEILIGSLPIESIEPSTLRKKVGIALQNAPIMKGTVFENIALPYTLQQKKLSEKEAISCLENVGLNPDFLYRSAEDLSGGQKQKVSIARSLLNQPEILLLDEITSALDPTSAKEIEELILKINQQHEVTIIWITHNIEQAKRVGDYTWVLINGQLAESGNSTILTESKNQRIQQFTKGVKEQ
ncbi:phosphate ABC transporter ATP-binding protein [Lysinibacillus yapensis]|uniref:Phosphate ABC transporter ATP-binding protein n=1 Tax=Ureibacillus yapensis TaxID=2304605 RepID=A0A396S384_9BACL|nr:phosphate ABC transporter ATP-binding protein [Lysinibacillus yapensis]RHW32421.1 phosphate ABC transporter ATP-binding protein [Lysinibacillus yapensis]